MSQFNLVKAWNDVFLALKLRFRRSPNTKENETQARESFYNCSFFSVNFPLSEKTTNDPGLSNYYSSYSKGFYIKYNIPTIAGIADDDILKTAYYEMCFFSKDRANKAWGSFQSLLKKRMPVVDFHADFAQFFKALNSVPHFFSQFTGNVSLSVWCDCSHPVLEKKFGFKNNLKIQTWEGFLLEVENIEITIANIDDDIPSVGEKKKENKKRKFIGPMPKPKKHKPSAPEEGEPLSPETSNTSFPAAQLLEEGELLSPETSNTSSRAIIIVHSKNYFVSTPGPKIEEVTEEAVCINLTNHV